MSGLLSRWSRYDRMSVDDLDEYEGFKADILRAYELRPEAYRL